jgi:hypothetical protein
MRNVNDSFPTCSKLALHHKLVNSTESYGVLKFEVESNAPELDDSKHRYAMYMFSEKVARGGFV